MSGEPDWSLIYWDWDTPKVTALLQLSLPINSLHFNSLDYTKGFTISGGETFQLYKLIEGEPNLECSEIPGRAQPD
jgi:hypothetical protein